MPHWASVDQKCKAVRASGSAGVRASPRSQQSPAKIFKIIFVPGDVETSSYGTGIMGPARHGDPSPPFGHGNMHKRAVGRRNFAQVQDQTDLYRPSAGA